MDAKKSLSLELRKANADLSLLYNIIEDIAGEIDLQRLSEKIAKEVKRRLNAEAVFLMLIDAEGLSLELIASEAIKIPKVTRIPITGIIKETFDSPSLHFGRLKIGSEVFASSLCVPLIIQEKPIGMIAICNKEAKGFTDGDKRVIQNIALVGSIIRHAVENAKLYKNLQTTYFQTLQVIGKTLESKSRYTQQHSEHVAEYAVLIVKKIKEKKELEESMIDKIRVVAQLHDIGKIGVNDFIVNKPCCLCEEEWKVMKEHPVKGYENIKPLDFIDEDVKLGIRHHHENFNGKGYPDGLIGEKIPLLARIMRVADSFDAMIFPRPYHPKTQTKEEAIEELKQHINEWYDPQIVEAFVEGLKEEGVIQ
ncbi:MAG: HD domain-containing protein [bacterium]|nr:HD domain-containing protein [bacterium]